MIAFWFLMAIARGAMALRGESMDSLFFPEPTNTTVFLLTGVALITLRFYLRARHHRRFKQKVGGVGSIDDMLKLTPREFEEMVVELYLMAGHAAKRTGATGDHGIDVVVNAKNGEKWVVQCKRWTGYVGEPVIRDFYGAMQHEKADKGTIITTGRFSRKAREWARGKPLNLSDGEHLLHLWKRASKRAKAQSTEKTASPIQTFDR